MEFNINIPENENEINSLTKKQKYVLLNSISLINENMRPLIVKMVEDIIYPLIKNETELNSLYLDPNYEYNDEGYPSTYVMAIFNNEWDSSDNYELKEKIDTLLAELAPFLPHKHDDILEIDLDDLRYKKQNVNKSKKNLL